MGPEDPLQRAREDGIAELEERIVRRGASGVSLPVSILAIVIAFGLLLARRQEISYFFASETPLILGVEGGYEFDRLKSNAYAQIHGIPTVRGLYATENGRRYVMVGVRDTPIVVRRHPLPGEEPMPGRAGPQPNQSPFGIRGRLLRQSDVPQYSESIGKLLRMGELRARDGAVWMLLEGERPGADLKTLFSTLALFAFVAINAWFVWRNLRHRFQSAKMSEAS
jgi:hypothetical protein